MSRKINIKTIILSLIIFVISISFAVAADDSYQKMTIVLGHAAPINDPRHTASITIKEFIEKESQGAIRVDVYPASQLGSITELAEGTQGGSLQLCVMPPATLVGFQPLMALMDLPFFFPFDAEKTWEVLSGTTGKTLLKTLEEVNMVGLAFWDVSYKHFTANKPLRTLDDFKGLKFRVMPSDVLMAMISALGGDAVTTDYSEVYTGLQTHMIDGQEASIVNIENMKFYEVQKYLTKTYHIKSVYTLFGNKDWYYGLNEKTKDLIDRAVDAATKVANEELNKQESVAEEIIRRYGTEIVELTFEERAVLEDAAKQRCIDLYLKRNGDKGKALVELFMQSF